MNYEDYFNKIYEKYISHNKKQCRVINNIKAIAMLGILEQHFAAGLRFENWYYNFVQYFFLIGGFNNIQAIHRRFTSENNENVYINFVATKFDGYFLAILVSTLLNKILMFFNGHDFNFNNFDYIYRSFDMYSSIYRHCPNWYLPVDFVLSTVFVPLYYLVVGNTHYGIYFGLLILPYQRIYGPDENTLFRYKENYYYYLWDWFGYYTAGIMLHYLFNMFNSLKSNDHFNKYKYYYYGLYSFTVIFYSYFSLSRWGWEPYYRYIPVYVFYLAMHYRDSLQDYGCAFLDLVSNNTLYIYVLHMPLLINIPFFKDYVFKRNENGEYMRDYMLVRYAVMDGDYFKVFYSYVIIIIFVIICVIICTVLQIIARESWDKIYFMILNRKKQFGKIKLDQVLPQNNESKNTKINLELVENKVI
eukprot:Mrub_04045.p1 GENE.Mrub_04045~~Mrub_04045.p1  ORF type:complete len:429 (-),score=-11.26 Mrub_04045:56-1303(-)